MTRAVVVDGFTAVRSELAPAMQRVSLARSRRDIIPILAGTLIEYGKGSVQLTCTDGEQAVTTRFVADTRGTGAVVVSCALLAEVIAGLQPDAVMVFEAGAKRSVIKAGQSKVVLPGLPAEEFPPLDPGKVGGATASFAGAALVDAISRANGLTVASQLSSSTPALGGVLLDMGDQVTVVACDRYRLIRIPLAVDQGKKPLKGKFVLPKTATALVKLFAGAERVAMAGTQERISFSTDTTTFVTRLLGDSYPETEKLFRKESNRRIEVDVAPLVAALHRVSAVVEERITMTFRSTPAEIRLTCSTTRGEAEDVVATTCDAIEPLEMGMNPSLLISTLAAIAVDRVVLALNSPTGALEIRPADSANATRAIVQPMRIP